MGAPAAVEGGRIFEPTVSEMPHTADVVIIGGGMAGPAASWGINRLDPTLKTVLLEPANALATGASSASIENFRSCWPTPCLIAQMERSIEIFTHADEYLGPGAQRELNVRQHGYLYTAHTQSQADILRGEVEDLHQKGLPHIEFLDRSEVQKRYPWLGDSTVAAKFDPTAGWLNSNTLARLYSREGPNAKFLVGMDKDALQIIVEGDHVVGVMTGKGFIQTNNVVIAAGPGSRQIGRTAGLELPIVMRPRHSFTIGLRNSRIPADAPFVIANDPFAYMRPEGEGAIFGWEYKWKNRVDHGNGTDDYLVEPVPLHNVKDGRVPSMILRVLDQQFSSGVFNVDENLKREVSLQNGYYVSRGPDNSYQDTPDGRVPINSQRAIIDSLGIEGLYGSIAHVGHGVMASAASGEMIGAYVLGQELAHSLFYQFGLEVHYVPEDGGSL